MQKFFAALLQPESKTDLAFLVPPLLLPRLGNMYHEPLECVQSLSGPSKQVRRVELRMFSSIAPSSLALPPEMVFQRATGGMPVHITVYRDWLSKLLTYMQQPFTRREILPLAPSLSPYISTAE